MKVGDLVKHNHPSRLGREERIGVVISEDACVFRPSYKAFKVLWHDGTIGNKVWDCDLKIVKNS